MRAAPGATTRSRHFARRVATCVGLVAALAAFGALAPVAAIAQTATPIPVTGSGVSVIGYGEASAPAEMATLQLLVTRGDYYGGPPIQPRPGDIPGEEEKREVAPIVQALVAKGVAESAITLVVSPVLGSSSYGPGGPAVARIDVAVENPDLAGLTDLVRTASIAAAEESLVLGQVGAEYDVADCAAIDRAAREAAIIDARARAEVQADLLGVTLGDVTASSDVPPSTGLALNYFGFPVSMNNCTPPAPSVVVAGPGLGVTVATFDPTAEVEVEVYAQINLTFAIAA